MTYYVIRHKLSGQLMPLMLRGRGYSHWNPNINKTVFSELPVPRLLNSRKQAERVISGWYNCPNSRNDTDGDMCLGPMDNRRKEDLEIIKVFIRVKQEKKE